MIVYQFLYCCSIHESSYFTVSTHFTKKGAEKAMRKHKNLARKEHLEAVEYWNKQDPEHYKLYPYSKFGLHEDWKVKEITIID